MNPLDIALALILAIPAALGLWKGLVQPLVGAGGLVLGVVLALRLSEPTANWLSRGTNPQGWEAPLAFAGLLLGALLLGLLAGRLIEGLLREAGLRWVDRLSGMGVGLCLGSLLALAVVVGGAATLPTESRLLENSWLAPRIVQSLRSARYLLPAGMQERFNDRLSRLSEADTRPEGSETGPEDP